jgi:two-component sensor histidine kinase
MLFPRYLFAILLMVLSLVYTRALSYDSDNEKDLLKVLRQASNDTARVKAMIKLADFYVNKPGEDPGDLSLAADYAIKANYVSKKNSYLWGTGAYFIILARIAKEEGKREESREYSIQAINIFNTNSRYALELAEANLELSNSYNLSSDAELANKIRYYEHGVNVLRTAAPHSIKLADALKFLGDLYNVKDDNQKSVALLKESLKIYKAKKYGMLQDIYSLLGAVLSSMGNTREGIKYLLLASKTADLYRDSSSTVVTIYNRMGTVYNGMNQLENSGKAFKKSLFLAERNKDKDGVLFVSSNLSWVYIRLNQPNKAIAVLNKALKNCSSTDTAQRIDLNTTLMEAYLKTNQVQDALECYKRTRNDVKKFYTYDFLQVNYYNASAKLFLAIKDFDKLSSTLDSFKVASNKTKSIRDLAAVELFGFQLDSALGKPWQAMAHLKKFKLLSDSLNVRNHDKQLARIQAEFDSDKKDLEIVSKTKDIDLLKNRAALQERALSSERTSRNLLIAGMVLLAMLLGLAYNRYVIKRNANLDLEKKQGSINEQNLSLRQLLIEREWLLKEIHHRVKNNLQIIISLLDSQSVFLTDDSALSIIRESQHRMNCISLVHQKLYQDENLSGIEMRNYIYELIEYMKDSFGTGSAIAFVTQVDYLVLDVSQAVPLGLILNESITNSLKYAFSGNQNSTVTVKLRVTGNFIDLSIGDNGCGLPEDFDVSSDRSLGMSLIHGLTKQLGGELEFLNNNGLLISIKIPKLKILSENHQRLSITNEL